MNGISKIGSMALGAVLATGVFASDARATIVTFYDGITAGVNSFDGTVTGAGGTVVFDVWSSLGSTATSIDRGDYTITRNNGGSLNGVGYGSMSGEVVSIGPSGGGSNPRTNPLDYFISGLTLTFDSAINSVGFEVADWATCCHAPVTELFVSFDGGAPITVGSATQYSDGQFPSQNNPSSLVPEIFVGAADDSATFTTVSFWGNGIGEVLYMGGQVRYGTVSQGSLPPASPVPLPATGLMLIGGFGALALRGRRRRDR